MAKLNFTSGRFGGALGNDGKPIANGKIYFNEPGTGSGTTVPKDTYTTSSLTIANTNPVTLDAYGRAPIWLSGDYSVRVVDANGVLITSDDNVNPVTTLTGSQNFNLVENGSFETDSDANSESGGWTVIAYSDAGSGGGFYTLDTSTQRHGSQSLKFTSSGDGGGTAETIGFLEVTPDRPLETSFIMHSSVAGVRNVISILWYTSVYSTISTQTILDLDGGNPTTATLHSINVVPPSTARYAKLRLTGCHNSNATVGSTWFDNVVISSGTVFLENSVLTSDTTIGMQHTNRIVEVSGTGITLSLDDAATLIGPWGVTLYNSGTQPVTIGRITSGDTIDGVAQDVSLSQNNALEMRTNSSNNGFISTSRATPIPRNYLSGLGISIGTDTDHDIDIAPGECTDSTNTTRLTSTSVLTKQIDASFAAGTNAGGMFTGTVANSTTYYIHEIIGNGIDAGFDVSNVAANIPSGFTKYCLRGRAVTDSSANIESISEFLDNDGKKQQTTLILPSALISFPDLDGNSANGYRLTVHAETSGATAWAIRLNLDSTDTNYRRRILGGATVATSLLSSNASAASTLHFDALITIRGGLPIWQVTYSHATTSAVQISTEAFSKIATISNITSIEVFSTVALVAGSTFRLEEL